MGGGVGARGPEVERSSSHPPKNKILFPTRTFSASISPVSPRATRPSSSISTHKNATTVTPGPRTRHRWGPGTTRTVPKTILFPENTPGETKPRGMRRSATAYPNDRGSGPIPLGRAQFSRGFRANDRRHVRKRLPRARSAKGSVERGVNLSTVINKAQGSGRGARFTK